MESERERIKKALLAEIGGMVDEMLEWEEKHSAPNLVEIEEVVLKIRQWVGQQLAQFLVERQGAVRPVPGPACPQCGKGMRYKGSGPVTVMSRVGPLDIRRGYYYCERCHSGLFPLDQQLGLRNPHWSEGVVKEVVRLSALMPYEQVAEALERIGQIPNQGHALRIAQELEGEAERRPRQAEELRRETGYFRNNARRMNYMEMREEGWVTGSGAVESGVEQIKERFAGPGMRWSRIGAKRLLPVRTAVMNQRFDPIWSELYALL